MYKNYNVLYSVHAPLTVQYCTHTCTCTVHTHVHIHVGYTCTCSYTCMLVLRCGKYPSCWQTIRASSSPKFAKEEAYIVPHTPALQNSTRPSLSKYPPTRRTSPSVQLSETAETQLTFKYNQCKCSTVNSIYEESSNAKHKYKIVTTCYKVVTTCLRIYNGVWYMHS